MITVPLKLFTFDELNDTAKQKAINDYIVMEYNNPYLNDEIESEFNYYLKDIGIETSDFKYLYSLGYCQGDGMTIEGTLNNEELINLVVCDLELSDSEQRLANGKQWLKLLKAVDICARIYQHGHYYNYNNQYVELHYEFGNLNNKGLELINNFETDLQDMFRTLSKQLESRGYGIIELYTDHDRIAEQLSDDETTLYDARGAYKGQIDEFNDRCQQVS